MCDGLIKSARARICRWIPVLLATLYPFISVGQEQSPPPEILSVDETLSPGEIPAGRSVSFAFEATEGETYLIAVDQNGLDFNVSLTSPAGQAKSYNSPLFRDERELVVETSALQGTYELVIVSDEHTGAIAHPEVSLSSLTGTSGSTEIEALSLMSDAAAANFLATPAGWDAAVAAYESAARLWAQLDRPRELAEALYSTASIEYWQRVNWQRSAELAGEAAVLYSDLDEETLSANAIHLRAAALVEWALEIEQPGPGERTAESILAEAFALLEEARSVHARLGNTYDLGLVTNNFGYTHYYLGNLSEARPYYERAATLLRDINEWTAELNPLSNLALLDGEQGYLSSMIETLERTISILPPDQLLRYRADTLDNLAAAQRSFGDLDDALQGFASALELHEEIGDRKGEARSLLGLGQTYYSFGELELATEYLERALPKVQEANDGRSHEVVLRTLGNTALLQTDYSRALEFHRSALNLATTVFDRVRLQILISRDFAGLGDTERSLEFAMAAYDGAEQSKAEILLADASLQMGRSLLATSAADRAMRNFDAALLFYTELNLQDQQADALNGLALAAKRLGKLTDAIEFGAKSLDLLERLRTRVASPELRAFHSSLRRRYYETQVQSLIEARDTETMTDEAAIAAALEVSERSRARMTIDLLGEAAVDLDHGLDSAMANRRAGLYERLADLRYQRDQLLEQAGDGSVDNENLDQIIAEMNQVESSLFEIEIESAKANSRYAAIGSAQILSAAEIQRQLEPGSVLLQYSLGDAKSFVWVVTRDFIGVFPLSDRATIEASARRVFERLSSYPQVAANGRRESDSLAELSALILDPLADTVEAFGPERILVAAEGALQYIPFAALPVGPDRQALLETGAVLTIPSMSVIAAQATRSMDTSSDGLAVYADPVFEHSDSRVTGAKSSGAIAQTESLAFATRSGTATGTTLQRLTWTAYEADRISRLFPEEHRLVAEGFAANRDRVLSTDLGHYRYLHFATHGLIDSRFPALSALAMSQYDAAGVRQNGMLRLHDIYNLDLNADLVVLSACETALGREIRGEGLIGLTQGFMYAGARNLVVSLWQVPDRATAEFMVEFYENMLEMQLSPAEALNRAQKSMAGDRATRDPFYWAGFVLVGNGG